MTPSVSPPRIHLVRGTFANSYVLENSHGLFLIDAGFLGHERALARKIEGLEHGLTQIRLAIVTHGHADHYGGLAALQDTCDFDVLCHPDAVELLESGGIDVSPGRVAWARAYARAAGVTLELLKLRAVRRVAAVTPGQRLDGLGLPARILETPGHSGHCISVVLDDGSAFVGDLVQGARTPVTPPELPAMAVDEAALLASWRALLDAGAKRVYPAHGRILNAEDLEWLLADARGRRGASERG